MPITAQLLVSRKTPTTSRETPITSREIPITLSSRSAARDLLQKPFPERPISKPPSSQAPSTNAMCLLDSGKNPNSVSSRSAARDLLQNRFHERPIPEPLSPKHQARLQCIFLIRAENLNSMSSRAQRGICFSAPALRPRTSAHKHFVRARLQPCRHQHHSQADSAAEGRPTARGALK
jgi:hypothetical protein